MDFKNELKSYTNEQFKLYFIFSGNKYIHTHIHTLKHIDYISKKGHIVTYTVIQSNTHIDTNKYLHKHILTTLVNNFKILSLFSEKKKK